MTNDDTPAARRAEIVRLRAATLQAQTARMGLKTPDEEISPAAKEKIRKDVEALMDEDLPRQIAHWTDLHRRALDALAGKKGADA